MIGGTYEGKGVIFFFYKSEEKEGIKIKKVAKIWLGQGGDWSERPA